RVWRRRQRDLGRPTSARARAGKQSPEEGARGGGADRAGAEGDQRKKMVSASVRREQVRYATSRGMSGRAACRALGTARSSLGYRTRLPARDAVLKARMRAVAARHQRFGYRRVTAVLRREGQSLNPKRVYRLWREEGLILPRRRKRRPRLDRPRP